MASQRRSQYADYWGTWLGLDWTMDDYIMHNMAWHHECVSADGHIFEVRKCSFTILGENRPCTPQLDMDIVGVLQFLPPVTAGFTWGLPNSWRPACRLTTKLPTGTDKQASSSCRDLISKLMDINVWAIGYCKDRRRGSAILTEVHLRHIPK